MIKKITITNHLNESLELELARPELSGFVVREVTGLGPSRATINTTKKLSDGSFYNSARVDSRNIVMSLNLLGTPTIEDTRQRSYKFFPLKRKINIKIETDNRSCETYGYVESNEPNIFSKSQAIQISIVCPNPFLYSLSSDVTILSGLDSLFQFPFSNESRTQKLINFGEIITANEQIVMYEGDVEIGVVISIKANGPAEDLRIYKDGTKKVMTLYSDRLIALTGQGISLGDEIIISTVSGDKFVRLFRNGEYINIINCIDKNSDWLTLHKGLNIFAYVADGGSSNLEVAVSNKILYEGV